MTELAGVILAGGKSSRMGRDKALLSLQGKRLVDRVAEVVHTAGIKDVYVSGEVEGYTNIPDLLAQRGPVGGICSSIIRLAETHRRVLFIPVDMPLLCPELLLALVKHDPEISSYFEHHPLPCILPLNAEMLRHVDVISQALSRHETVAVKDFLAGLNASPIAVPEPLIQALANTNTPAQWQEATHESAYQ